MSQLAENILVSDYLDKFIKRKLTGLNFSVSISFLKKLVSFIERKIGITLYVNIPPELKGLEDIDPHLIKVSILLNQMGLLPPIQISKKYADEPKLYRARTKEGGGADLFNLKNALWKAIAETLERSLWRYSDEFYKTKITRGTYAEMSRRGAINPASFVGFSEEQKAKHKNLQFDNQTIFNWIPAHLLNEKKKVLIPVQLVSAHYWKTVGQDCEPMIRWQVTTGLATGRTQEEALYRGILEVIERDAFMITFLNKCSPPRLNLQTLARQDHELENIFNNILRYNLELHLVKLPTDINVEAIAAILIDRTNKGPAFTIGAKADLDLKSAICGALAEASSVRYAFKNKWKNPVDIKNIGRDERVIYWLNLEKLPKIQFLFSGAEIFYDLPSSPTETRLPFNQKNTRQSLTSLLRVLGNQHHIYYVDLTPKEIRRLGLNTIFVTIPDLQPMHLNESLPYTSGKRLESLLTSLGYTLPETLNTDPHPFP